MGAIGNNTYLVTVSAGSVDRSFTVSGLSAEEVHQLLSRAAEGRAYRVVELSVDPAQGPALNHLTDATGTLGVVFIVTALVLRRLKRWLQQ
ncbi:MAG: hypothetical protein NDI91_18860 [Sulfuritalea sp.]|nr:hypothetical protein [Sulfuritalea sp.]